jgi:hypothetical protein
MKCITKELPMLGKDINTAFSNWDERMASDWEYDFSTWWEKLQTQVILPHLGEVFSEFFPMGYAFLDNNGVHETVQQSHDGPDPDYLLREKDFYLIESDGNLISNYWSTLKNEKWTKAVKGEAYEPPHPPIPELAFISSDENSIIVLANQTYFFFEKASGQIFETIPEKGLLIHIFQKGYASIQCEKHLLMESFDMEAKKLNSWVFSQNLDWEEDSLKIAVSPNFLFLAQLFYGQSPGWCGFEYYIFRKKDLFQSS